MFIKFFFVATFLSLVISHTQDKENHGHIRQLPVPLTGLKEKPEEYILGGQSAVPGQFPHQVTLYVDYGLGRKGFFCGGSLIGVEWVLTAAHCTEGYSTISVLIGATDRSVLEPTQESRTARGIQIKNHENYDSRTIKNDIALIRLYPPIELTDYIKVVSLPTPSDDPLAFTKVYPSGWGYTSEEDKENGIVENTLQYTEVPVKSRIQCNMWWGPNYSRSQICIKSNGKGVCQGDSGGPLNSMEDMSSGGFVFGIASFVGSQCDSEDPHVFTRVSSFLNWIERKTGITPLNEP